MNIDVHSKIRLLNYCETEFGEYGEYATNDDEGMNNLIESMEWNDCELELYVYNNDDLDKEILFSYGGGRGLESISMNDLNERVVSEINQNRSHSEFREILTDGMCIECYNYDKCNYDKEFEKCIDKLVNNLRNEIEGE